MFIMRSDAHPHHAAVGRVFGGSTSSRLGKALPSPNGNRDTSIIVMPEFGGSINHSTDPSLKSTILEGTTHKYLMDFDNEITKASSW